MTGAFGPQWPTTVDVAVARDYTRALHLTGAPDEDYQQAAREERQTSSAFTSDHAWAQRAAELEGDGVDVAPGVAAADRQPATAAEAWTALCREGAGADAVRSYLAPGPQPRYDTPAARAEAQADREAGQ